MLDNVVTFPATASASVPKARSFEEFVALINGTWGKTAAAFFENGQHIVQARTELGNRYKPLLKALACGVSTAKKLACIGGKLIFGSHVNELPPHLTTLYALSQVKDDILTVAFADGRIHPGMSLKDAIALRKSGIAEERDPPPKPEPSIDFAAVWDAVIRTETGRKQITAKLDQVGRAELCGLMSEKLRTEFFKHASAAVDLPRTSDANAHAEIATLTRECSALLTHPEQHVDEIRKRLARIRKLTGSDESRRKPAAKSNAKLDLGALPRALTLGKAGPPGQKFTTITIMSNGVDAEGNSAFGEPPDQGSRH